MASKKSNRVRPESPTRRGSSEAIAKRRAARAFNELLAGGSKRDGRTEKKRQRLLAELKEGTSRSGKRALKPIDVLLRVQTLLELGETVASLRKVCRPVRVVDLDRDAIALLRRLHSAYGFRIEAYQFVGIDDALLGRAGIRRGEAPSLAKTSRPSRHRAA
jgi:hypothetical protein